MKYKLILDDLKGYMIACVLAFFVVPMVNLLFPQYSGTIQLIYQLICILVVDITSFLCGYRHFHWYYPFIVVFLYVFSVMVENLFSEESVLVSTLFFLLISYISLIIGFVFAKLRERNSKF